MVVGGQQTPSVDQTRWHGATQRCTAVGYDAVVSVRVARLFISPLTGPRTFDVFIRGEVGGY